MKHGVTGLLGSSLFVMGGMDGIVLLVNGYAESYSSTVE
jgi:hypothetical protein